MPETDARSAIFRREGEYWTIAWTGRLIRLRDSKGLGYVSRLLDVPAEAVHVDELVGIAAKTPVLGASPRPPDRRRIAVTKAIRTALRKICEHDAVLGERLQAAIRTGTFCSYVPGNGCPDSWER